nr:MAG TPA: hypothetical protein [Caudoviricetes sp.]
MDSLESIYGLDQRKIIFKKVLTPERIDAIIIVSVNSGVFFIERKLRQKEGVFK